MQKKISTNLIWKLIWIHICCMCHKSIKTGLITLFCLSLFLFLPLCFSLSNVQKAFSLRGSGGFFSVCVLCTVKAEAHARDIKQLWNSGESRWLSACRLGWAPNIMLAGDRCQILTRKMQNHCPKEYLLKYLFTISVIWLTQPHYDFLQSYKWSWTNVILRTNRLWISMSPYYKAKMGVCITEKCWSNPNDLWFPLKRPIC